MPYALFCNESKLSKTYPTEADVWKLARQSGLVVDAVSEAEKAAPRPVLDNDYEMGSAGRPGGRGSRQNKVEATGPPEFQLSSRHNLQRQNARDWSSAAAGAAGPPCKGS
jgi:hypothetical protein